MNRCVGDHDSAQKIGDARAYVNATRVNALRGRTPLWRKIIGDQRPGRGRKRCFADAHAGSHQEYLREVASEAATGREQAPHDEACSDESTAAAAVRNAPQRQTKEGVEHGEAETG